MKQGGYRKFGFIDFLIQLFKRFNKCIFFAIGFKFYPVNDGFNRLNLVANIFCVIVDPVDGVEGRLGKAGAD